MKSKTILLVEDEAPVRSLARTLLERKGYQVIEAETGLSALEIWQERRDTIDLLFTDMVMPGGIGAVLYFLLRQPQISRCPACGTHVQSDFHYCPQCNRQLVTSCGNCFLSVLPADQYCTRCGHELAVTSAHLRVVER